MLKNSIKKNQIYFLRPLFQGQIGQLQRPVRLNKVHFLLCFCVHVGPPVFVVRGLVGLSKRALGIRGAIGKREEHKHSGGEVTVRSMGPLSDPVVPNGLDLA